MQTAPWVTNYLTEHFADDAFRTLDGYRARGGYEAAKQALGMKPADVIELLKTSGLQGRGGAGFGTGLKWSFMPTGNDRPKYLVCNADESEPGSFKDRLLIERGPHQMLEGLVIGGWATGAEKTFIYIRGEYAEPARILAGRHRRRVPRRHPRQGRDGQRLRARGRAPARRRRVHLRRGDRPPRVARGQEGPAAQEAALPRRSTARSASRPPSTTSRRSATCRTS